MVRGGGEVENGNEVERNEEVDQEKIEGKIVRLWREIVWGSAFRDRKRGGGDH